ncbi:MAG: hypothetical protein AB7K09_00690 [Planctomycetota bacterium]
MLDRARYILTPAALLILALALATPARSQDAAAAQDLTTLQGFATGLPEGWQARQLDFTHEVAADGGGFARLHVAAGEYGWVRLPVPAGVAFAEHDALVADLRVVRGESLRLRVLALDGDGRPIFQRLADAGAEPGATGWHRLVLPLEDWRWGDRFCGPWSEVREIAIVIIERAGAATLELDRLALRRGTRGAQSAMPDQSWLLRIAYGAEATPRIVTRQHVLLATDVPADKASDEALAAMADRLEPLHRWLATRFGDAVRSIDSSRPVALLVMRDADSYKSMFVRLGEAWDVTIAPPQAQGYTVQDVAVSSFDPAIGFARPVFLHETLHAMISRELRVNCGVAANKWLQEGLANYLQLALYRQSIGRDALVKNFRTPPRADGRGFFKPMRVLLTQPVTGLSYLQLASLMAFIDTQHRDWFPRIARGVADGQPVERVLASVGTDFAKLEAEWYAWGAKAFAEDAEPPAGPGSHFAWPEEWPREDGSGDSGNDGLQGGDDDGGE